jgi:hypothetical protein
MSIFGESCYLNGVLIKEIDGAMKFADQATDLFAETAAGGS